MNDADRFRLLGRYHTPRVRIGTVLSCEARDCDVVVVGYSGGRIPWPIGRRKGSGSLGLIVFGGLAKAVRRESAQAVGHWGGAGRSAVWRWGESRGGEGGEPGAPRVGAGSWAGREAGTARRSG